MEHRYTLLKFLEEGREEEMMEWIKSHSDLEQLQILDEYKELMKEIAAETDDDEMKEDMGALEGAIANYENAILDEQVDSLKKEMADREISAMLDQADIHMQNMRDLLTKTYLSNPPNIEDIRNVIANMIQIEKDHGLHDPENWKGLPEL